jgi:hypothetical protein
VDVDADAAALVGFVDHLKKLSDPIMTTFGEIPDAPGEFLVYRSVWPKDLQVADVLATSWCIYCTLQILPPRQPFALQQSTNEFYGWASYTHYTLFVFRVRSSRRKALQRLKGTFRVVPATTLSAI